MQNILLNNLKLGSLIRSRERRRWRERTGFDYISVQPNINYETVQIEMKYSLAMSTQVNIHTH